jgi:hypothetical protein
MFRLATKHLPWPVVVACCMALVGCGGSSVTVPSNVVVADHQPRAWPTAVVQTPDAPPHLLRVWLSTLTIHPGMWLDGSVVADTNVASVEIRTAAFSINCEHVGPGLFRFHTLFLELPPLSRRHTYQLDIIARNTPGDEEVEHAPLRIE